MENILDENVLLKGPAFVVTHNGTIMVINPTGHYDTVPAKHLIEKAGVLPMWLLQGLEAGEDAQTALMSRYAIATPPMIGGTVQDNGVYTYRGDDDLHPMAVVEADTPNETIYFYEYAMVSIVNVDTGKTLTYRMD